MIVTTAIKDFGKLFQLYVTIPTVLKQFWLRYLPAVSVIDCSQAYADAFQIGYSTNTISNLDKYNLLFGQMQFAVWTNTVCNLDKCSF